VKPGDLVRTCQLKDHVQVCWVQFKQRSSGVEHEPIPAGTPAVFLGTAPADALGAGACHLRLQSLILIRGEVGHAWPNELEAV
jgi:hypothetical protein